MVEVLVALWTTWSGLYPGDPSSNPISAIRKQNKSDKSQLEARLSIWKFLTDLIFFQPLSPPTQQTHLKDIFLPDLTWDTFHKAKIIC